MVCEWDEGLRFIIESHNLPVRAEINNKAKLIVFWCINNLIQAYETLMLYLFHNLDFAQRLIVLRPHR
jgi:hypothetical protein